MVIAVSGDTVTARLDALETDGYEQAFEGTYTVKNGVIVRFNVRRVD